MIEFTPNAIRKILEMQSEQKSAESAVLRLSVSSGGCSGFEYGMSFDTRQDGDVVVREEDFHCVIDPKSLDRLQGSVVDFDDGLHGKGFAIKNPNAAETCGCGRSFQ